MWRNIWIITKFTFLSTVCGVRAISSLNLLYNTVVHGILTTMKTNLYQCEIALVNVTPRRRRTKGSK